MKAMKAFAVTPQEPGSGRILEVPAPTIGPNEVLVRLRLVGLDATDQEINAGAYGEPPPGEDALVIGHESLGEVVQVGEGVASLSEGDLVVATVRHPDDCINCRAGEYDTCLKGNYTERGIKGRHGYLAEYYTEEEGFLIKVPAELGDLPVLLEPLSVAEKAVRVAYDVQGRLLWEPEVALVTGSGTLGLLTAALLRLRGLEVVVADRSDNEYKKGILSALGASHINTRQVNLHDIPRKAGRQLDMIFEETGSSSVALHAMSVVGTNGVVMLLSVTGGDKRVEICADCLNQGLVLGNKAVVGSVSSHRQDFERGLKDMAEAERRWPGLLGKLITARYGLDEVPQALAAMRENIKVAIEF
jgi:threonine dehydrogenase-like Zn-dependent dehydrogenase